MAIKKSRNSIGELCIDYTEARHLPKCPKCGQHGKPRQRWNGTDYWHKVREYGYRTIEQSCDVYDSGLDAQGLIQRFPLLFAAGNKSFHLMWAHQSIHVRAQRYAETHPGVRRQMISEEIALAELRGF